MFWGFFTVFIFLPLISTTQDHPDLTTQLYTILQHSQNAGSDEAAKLLQNLNSLQSHQNSTGISTQDSNDTSKGSADACTFGKPLFGPNNFLDVSSAAYINVTDENWSQTSWLPARCVFQPASYIGVAVALKICVFFGAQFAVRSGGHNPNSGYASIDQSGLLIDLVKLDSLNISEDRKSVQVGPGNRWIDVYNYLDAYGLSAIGTKEPGPGVGGSILGGGDPFFPALHGFACDSVKEFEILLGNATLTHANANENADLYIALKGGGPNFGIITAYTLYTYPLHEASWKMQSYPNTSNPVLFKALDQYQQSAEKDPKVNIIFTTSGSTTVVSFLYAEHSLLDSDAFSAFAAIDSMHALSPPTNGTIRELCFAIGGLDSPLSASRGIAAVSTSGYGADLYMEIDGHYNQLANSVPNDATLILSYQATTRSTVVESRTHGDNSMGLTPQPQMWFAILLQWSNSTSTTPCDKTIRALTSAINTVAAKGDRQLSFVYQNDAGYFQSPFESLTPGTYESLVTTSLKFDPGMVFQHSQRGGFLLGA